MELFNAMKLNLNRMDGHRGTLFEIVVEGQIDGFFFVLFTFDRYRQLDKKKRSQFVNDFSIEEKQIQIRFYLSMEYLLL